MSKEEILKGIKYEAWTKRFACGQQTNGPIIRDVKITSYLSRISARKRRRLRTQRAIASHWDRTPRIRRIAYRSKCGLSEFGKWFYDIMFKDIPARSKRAGTNLKD